MTRDPLFFFSSFDSAVMPVKFFDAEVDLFAQILCSRSAKFLSEHNELVLLLLGSGCLASIRSYHFLKMVPFQLIQHIIFRLAVCGNESG